MSQHNGTRPPIQNKQSGKKNKKTSAGGENPCLGGGSPGEVKGERCGGGSGHTAPGAAGMRRVTLFNDSPMKSAYAT